MIIDIDIDELERKAKAATPGPWFAEDRTPKGAGFSLIAPAAPYHSGLVAHYCSSADAAFVASANPAAILELVAEVRRLRALSVENIMLDVTPGFDGMGHEEYAESVDDVESKLSEMGLRLEDLEGANETLRAEIKRLRRLENRVCPAAHEEGEES